MPVNRGGHCPGARVLFEADTFRNGNGPERLDLLALCDLRQPDQIGYAEILAALAQ
jgi:predicted metal-binding protein